MLTFNVVDAGGKFHLVNAASVRTSGGGLVQFYEKSEPKTYGTTRDQPVAMFYKPISVLLVKPVAE